MVVLASRGPSASSIVRILARLDARRRPHVGARRTDAISVVRSRTGEVGSRTAEVGLRISRHRERRFRGIVSIDFAAS
jgi:hypothetical protein